MRRLIFGVFGVLFLVQLEDVIGAKPRYAPKYCLRFKFDCTSAEKKGHVCCLFPLPIDGNGLLEKSALPETGPSAVSIGVKKIRPLRLPSRRNGDESNVGQEHSSHQNRYDVFNQKPHVKSDTTSVTHTPKRKEAPKKKTSIERTKPKKEGKRPSIRSRRPMICRRLVVNCRKNPSHSCCKFEEPPKNDIEEDAKKDNIVEEVTNKTVEIVVETTQNINEVEVSTIPLESNIESLKTLPELTIEEKGTNNAPVIRNDIVKQRLEARRIPSSKGSIKYKTIRLNTRERTRNVNTRKPAEQVVATIEAVPLDIVERDNPTNKRKLSEGKNDVTDSTRQVSQGLKKAPTTLQTLENGTTTHLSHVPLVELPLAEEEPYERIPAECFTMSFDCKTSPSHMCCAYHE